ncbi:MAG: agmatine deiminase family protein [Promethearchaeota archaeon]
MEKKKTPSEMGYHMPAEWHTQESVWISWPFNLETFDIYLPEVRQTYIDLFSKLLPGQFIDICINSDDDMTDIQHRLEFNGVSISLIKKIRFHVIPTRDVWFRDYGPMFLINIKAQKPRAMIDWEFNAWGNKYDDLLPDNQIPSKLNQNLRLPIFRPKIILEGGSIDVNGKGTLLTTEQCLLNPNRNPNLSRNDIEIYLKSYLGIKKILWLNKGIIGDDTDGHIDDIARFINVDTIVYANEDDSSDENFPILKENYRRLQNMTTADEKKIKLIPIPMPSPVYINEIRVPASYLNFYIGNEVVAMPTFQDSNDAIALDILQKCFPNRHVIGINCREMVYGLGTLHCATQQFPQVD